METAFVAKDTPTHYNISPLKENGNKNLDYILIAYNKIILDKGMSKKLKELCNGKYQGLKKFKKGEMINMNKIDTVQRTFEKKIPLDPIKVTQYKNSKYYEVLDVTNRYIMSLYYEYSHIPCIILESI